MFLFYFNIKRCEAGACIFHFSQEIHISLCYWERKTIPMVVYPDFKIDEAGGLVLVQIEPHAHRHISVLEILAFHNIYSDSFLRSWNTSSGVTVITDMPLIVLPFFNAYFN